MRITIACFCFFAILLIILTGFWPSVSGNVLPNTTWGLYSKSFFEDVIVGVHGTLIDLFIIGIVLYWFERRAEAREAERRDKAERDNAISRHIETLSDLRFYKGEDISHRNLTAIKHLMSLGVYDIPCSEVKLEGVKVEGLTFKKANMHAISFAGSKLERLEISNSKCDAAIFINARLAHVVFDSVSFARAKFCGAQLAGVDFSKCRLERADFSGANLRSAIFRNVDCKGINFTGADLRSANFLGATNLTEQMLSVAKSTAYIRR